MGMMDIAEVPDAFCLMFFKVQQTSSQQPRKAVRSPFDSTIKKLEKSLSFAFSFFPQEKSHPFENKEQKDLLFAEFVKRDDFSALFFHLGGYRIRWGRVAILIFGVVFGA